MTDRQENTVDHLNSFERETVINMSDGDTEVRIWTAQRRVISHLRNQRNFREIRSGYHGTSEWAEFLTPVGNFRFGAKARRAPMTEEQRLTAAENLRRFRERPPENRDSVAET